MNGSDWRTCTSKRESIERRCHWRAAGAGARERVAHAVQHDDAGGRFGHFGLDRRRRRRGCARGRAQRRRREQQQVRRVAGRRGLRVASPSIRPSRGRGRRSPRGRRRSSRGVDVAGVADEIVAERPPARPACRRRTASPADRRRAAGTRAATPWPTRCRARPRPRRGSCARPRAAGPSMSDENVRCGGSQMPLSIRRQEFLGARRQRAARQHRADAECSAGSTVSATRGLIRLPASR